MQINKIMLAFIIIKQFIFIINYIFFFYYLK